MAEQIATPELSQDKLYAGKFKTVEELEEGYKNSAKVFQQNESLAKKLEEVTKVPDQYNVPQDVTIDNLPELTTLAASASLTQAQFDKMLSESNNKYKSKAEQFESTKQSLGETTLQVLNEYVNKNYPEELSDVVMKQLVTDNKARDAALKHREQLLNSSVPGINKGSYTPQTVTHEDVMKCAEEVQKKPSDKHLRAKYLEVTAAYARTKPKDS